MGLFNKFVDVFKSNVNDALDKAEDPEKMIKLMVVEMQEAMTKATAGLAKAMAQEKKLENDFLKYRKLSEDSHNKAKQALQAGNEDLARQFLAKKSQADTNATQYEGMWQGAKTTTGTLRQQVDSLKAKLDEARTKESMLIARSQTAKAQKEISSHMNSYDAGSVFNKFEKFENKILEAESEAQAFTELADSNKSLDDQLKELTKGPQVDDELAALKAQLG